MRPRGERRYEIAIADDGRGLPEGTDLSQSKGLGWRIIQGLASQLDGEARHGTAPGGTGTEVRVEFAIA